MLKITRLFAATTLLAGASFAGTVSAQSANATTAASPSSPFPTINNLSVEWPISGDDNANGVVSVRFRAQGAASWSTGMPLRRVPASGNEGFTWTNRHSGSIFNLQPATTYDIELTLADPDGGSTQRTLSATTRAIPTPGTGTIKSVTPATIVATLNAANPGDVIQLTPGTYAGFQPTRDGAAGSPITIRGAAGAVVTGEIGLFTRQHWYLQNLTVVGRVRFNGSKHISIVGSHITGTSAFNYDTIVTYSRAENAYIADNTLVGPTVWAETSLGVNGANYGEGVVVTGPGHVIARNRASGFRDAISLLEGAGSAVDQYSIDIIDNVISEAGDDGIEADFCLHNCRVMRNTMTNVFIAMSSQPSLGGPTYFIRNSAYNVSHIAFKLYRGSVGDVVLHNTIVKHGDALAEWSGRPISRAYFRNNLFLGGPAGVFGGYESGYGRVVDMNDVTNSSMDYDVFGSTTGTFTGRIGGVSFTSLAQMQQLTTEKNARQADMTVFSSGVAFPTAPMTVYGAPDLNIRSTSVAADAGEVIPNVNDGYSGAAPDAGAFESFSAGAPPPPPPPPPSAADVIFFGEFE